MDEGCGWEIFMGINTLQSCVILLDGLNLGRIYVHIPTKNYLFLYDITSFRYVGVQVISLSVGNLYANWFII